MRALHEGYRLSHLEKEKFAGTILRMDYTAGEFYDVGLNAEEKSGWSAEFVRRKFPAPVERTSAEYDFPDRLFQDHWPSQFAWGIFAAETFPGDERPENLVAAIEISAEEWSRRLRVTELWVHPRHRRRGLASVLMGVVKEHMRLLRYRAVILETQSCNVAAIDFYRSQGFRLTGFDTCCYSNDDIRRREVRLEMGFLAPERPAIPRDRIAIVPETKELERRSEELCRRSFFNKHRPGCDEHLFLHELRKSRLFLPELSRVAMADGEVAGGIWYTSAFLELDGKRLPLVTFGPLCVEPRFQGLGIGGMLVSATLPLARKAGFPGVIIFGEPDYYPRLGFATCDKFGITTADGRNFDAFMGIELEEGGLSEWRGAGFHGIDMDSLVSPERLAEFDAQFPPLLAFSRPGQWT